MPIHGKLFIAPPYNDEMIEGITKDFSRLLGQKVALELIEDQSIIGGFRATINGKLYDASIQTKMKKLKGYL